MSPRLGDWRREVISDQAGVGSTRPWFDNTSVAITTVGGLGSTRKAAWLSEVALYNFAKAFTVEV